MHLLPVALGNTFQLVLLLNGIRIAASLGSINQLFGQALGNAFDVTERSFAGTDGEQSNGLVDTAERRHVDGLTTDGTGGTDTCAIFAGSAVDNGVDGNLNGVLVCEDVDDFESVGDDANSLELFTVVATVHHERAGKALDYRALGLPEAFDGISAGRMWNVDGSANVDVIGQ